MTTLTRKTAFTLSTSLVLVALVALSAGASHPKALLLAPEPDYCLPQFGFASFNIAGVGERVTFVQWGGLASQLGLEPGDLILSMNGFRLSYHGAWNDALQYAVANGGWVQLAIRDVRTGHLAYRQTFIGDGHIVGPITPKIHVGGYHPPVVHHKHHVGYPAGPVTPKSKIGSHHDNDVNKTIKKIAKLFD
jgi:membrane-associated protease RseP (regulator of RpoE activity)